MFNPFKPEYVIEFTGICGSKLRGVGIAFFTPYDSFKDFITRALSIISAPISFIILSLEAFFCGLYHATIALLIDLFRWDTENLLHDAVMGFGIYPILFTVGLLGIVLSPLINLIDVIGSLVMTARYPNGQNDFEEIDLFNSPAHPSS